MIETNEGYEIIAAESYRIDNTDKHSRIVLGRMMTTHGPMFVTWESIQYPTETGVSRDYFWGHYFSNGKAAYADYHRRLLEKYE